MSSSGRKFANLTVDKSACRTERALNTLECSPESLTVWISQGWKNPVAWSPFATKKYFWRPDHRLRWSIWRLSFRPRVQFGDPSFALSSLCEQTVLYGDRKTNDRFPKTKFKISKTFLVIRVALTWHTLTRPPVPPSPPPPPLRIR